MIALDQLIAPFRKADNLAALVHLVDDIDAMRVLTAWPYVPKAWEPPPDPAPEDANQRWAWIWRGVVFNAPVLLEMTELSTSMLDRKFTKLRAARLLFPDGTVYEPAEAFVRNHIKRGMQ